MFSRAPKRIRPSAAAVAKSTSRWSRQPNGTGRQGMASGPGSDLSSGTGWSMFTLKATAVDARPAARRLVALSVAELAAAELAVAELAVAELAATELALEDVPSPDKKTGTGTQDERKKSPNTNKITTRVPVRPFLRIEENFAISLLWDNTKNRPSHKLIHTPLWGRCPAVCSDQAAVDIIARYRILSAPKTRSESGPPSLMAARSRRRRRATGGHRQIGVLGGCSSKTNSYIRPHIRSDDRSKGLGYAAGRRPGSTKSLGSWPFQCMPNIGELACLEMKMIGKPYAEDPQVRFDEGGQDFLLRMILNGHEAGNRGYFQRVT